MAEERLKKNGDWMDHRVLDEPRPAQLVIKPHPGGVIFLGAILSLLGLWIVIGLLRYLFFGEPSPLILLFPIGFVLVYWPRFRVVNSRIVLDKTGDRVSIPRAEPVRLSDIEQLYVVRWDRHGSSRIWLNELNLKTVDGRRENLLITPFDGPFKEQAEKLSEWLGVPINWPAMPQGR